ncbi:putative ATP-dependent RNA helicase ddx4 [Desmophyllum pertusum]|uniref:RNA helicase n=1 Tax=Desmophyllum pertusum TaxID=174260 RepID=A0A9W9Z0P1_9CNID|nr:putative ATP-dependent RNA helicase ddx4 [Desmophyllum pertusum]
MLYQLSWLGEMSWPCAQTGSGKTAAFLLPVMTGMLNSGLTSSQMMETQCPQALCVSPTRELANQIFYEAKKFSLGTILRPVVAYGGVSVNHQLRQIANGCNFLVATPGRLLDFVEKGKVSLKSIQYLILDEADRMLDMGFEPSIRKLDACVCESKRGADFLASLLSQEGFPTTSIHGDRQQQEREEALSDFRRGRCPVLIATNVAARGLDIDNVKHVVNYDLPSEIDEFVHRIGRTGRIGHQGKATTFFLRGKDDKIARALVKVLSDVSIVINYEA